jgi:hypothetical protein
VARLGAGTAAITGRPVVIGGAGDTRTVVGVAVEASRDHGHLHGLFPGGVDHHAG